MVKNRKISGKLSKPSDTKEYPKFFLNTHPAQCQEDENNVIMEIIVLEGPDDTALETQASDLIFS
eukprot:608240-Amorphochlora_amoeboformis.AAC.1